MDEVFINDINDLTEDELNKFLLKVGQNVKRLRKERNISQLKLSNALGLNSSYIAGAEVLYRNDKFNLQTLYKISYILDVDMSEFFKEIPEEFYNLKSSKSNR
jgi:transcriptional regulator with XRE-family HTH domain